MGGKGVGFRVYLNPNPKPYNPKPCVLHFGRQVGVVDNTLN